MTYGSRADLLLRDVAKQSSPPVTRIALPVAQRSMFPCATSEGNRVANPISNADIQALAVTPYEALRDTLKSGDLLFASGDYLVSKAIQSVTRSPWSHVGIIFHLDSIDRVLLLESVEDMGVRFAPLSKYLKDYEKGRPYRGRIVLARCHDVNQNVVDDLAGFGIDELTRPYDKEEVGIILSRVMLGIGKKRRDREYICSELVYECFAHAGRPFAYDTRGFISPENIWADPHISLVDRIL
jgi:hypothetical protein